MFEEFGINAGFVEELHARYQQSPQSVDEQWRSFFAEQRRAGGPHETHGDTGGHAARMDQASVARPATPAPRPTITASAPD